MGLISGFRYVYGSISDNLQFIFANWVSHIFIGVFIATALYPLLGDEYRNRLNYFFFIFVPAVFSSVFPDLLFVVSTFISHPKLAGLRYLLEHGGSIHAVFHKTIALILVIPAAVFIVLVLVSSARSLSKKELAFPEHWIPIVSALSLFSAFLHIVMDATGWF